MTIWCYSPVFIDDVDPMSNHCCYSKYLFVVIQEIFRKLLTRPGPEKSHWNVGENPLTADHPSDIVDNDIVLVLMLTTDGIENQSSDPIPVKPIVIHCWRNYYWNKLILLLLVLLSVIVGVTEHCPAHLMTPVSRWELIWCYPGQWHLLLLLMSGGIDRSRAALHALHTRIWFGLHPRTRTLRITVPHALGSPLHVLGLRSAPRFLFTLHSFIHFDFIPCLHSFVLLHSFVDPCSLVFVVVVVVIVAREKWRKLLLKWKYQ